MVIPEPTSLILLGTGLVLLGFRYAVKRNRTAIGSSRPVGLLGTQLVKHNACQLVSCACDRLRLAQPSGSVERTRRGSVGAMKRDAGGTSGGTGGIRNRKFEQGRVIRDQAAGLRARRTKAALCKGCVEFKG